MNPHCEDGAPVENDQAEEVKSPVTITDEAAEQVLGAYAEVLRSGAGVELGGVRFMKQRQYEIITAALDSTVESRDQYERLAEARGETAESQRREIHRANRAEQDARGILDHVVRGIHPNRRRAVMQRLVELEERNTRRINEIEDLEKTVRELREERSRHVDEIGELRGKVRLAENEYARNQETLELRKREITQLTSLNERLAAEREEARQAASVLEFEANSLRDTQDMVDAYVTAYKAEVRRRAKTTHLAAHAAGSKARFAWEEENKGRADKEASDG